MKFNIPGKTYLVGEYAVLLGGSALGLATDPSFKLNFDSDVNFVVHPESPAGRYLQMNHRSNISGELIDPYHLGGFGRSTAEYWSAVLPDLLRTRSNLSDILDQYKSLHTGSGVDLVFQYLGEVSHVNTFQGVFEKLKWPFKKLDFFIVPTGLKINTHEHLSQLDINSLSDLPAISSKVVDAFKSADEEFFIDELSHWTSKLAQLKLTHSNSTELKVKLEKFKQIKLVKPCGALGADVLLVFFDQPDFIAVKNILNQNNLRPLSSSIDLTQGVESQILHYQIFSPEINHVG